MRKLVTKNWVYLSPGLVSGVGGGGRPLKLHVLFGGIVVRRFKC